jgi:hypothetical protein
MDIGSIFLILGLLVVVAVFIARPLLEGRSVELSQEEHELSTLLAEQDRLLTALQELDFDYTLGKIPEEDYPAQRAVLVQRGVEILRSLDALQAEVYPEDEEARLDAAIATRRAETAAMPVPAAGNGSGVRLKPAPLAVGQDDDLEALIANRRRDRKEKAAGFCPACGKPVQKSDHFCPKCGQPLAS